MGRSLSVNLDHIATLRQVRKTRYPSVAQAATLCEMGGADGITLHLRLDRRHIQDRDVELVREISVLPLTLEMSTAPDLVDFAIRLRPSKVTLVPERPEELTTEGGLDLSRASSAVESAADRCRNAGMDVCLFLEPDEGAIEKASSMGIRMVELHTGKYAHAWEAGDTATADNELDRIQKAVLKGRKLSMVMNAGHGLHYANVEALVQMGGISEFSIGHSIVSRAVFSGLTKAVEEMSHIIKRTAPENS